VSIANWFEHRWRFSAAADQSALAAVLRTDDRAARKERR
jgi:hypothetical protein